MCKEESMEALECAEHSHAAYIYGASVRDLVSLLDNPWLYRVWTYQEVMLSENPVLVCGATMMPWWRFAISILYLRITETWSDRHDPHGNPTSKLFCSLRDWRTLVMDRNELQNEGRLWGRACTTSILDLEAYNLFLSRISDLFMVEYWD